MTRRVRSVISARRSTACAASTSAADRPSSGSWLIGCGRRRWFARRELRSVSASVAGSTSSVPCTMFIPQANPNEPAFAGVSRTVVRSYAGSAALSREVTEHHPRRAVTRLLPVEDKLHRHPLADADDIGVIPAAHRHLHPLHATGELSRLGLARGEEEPAQPGDRNKRAEQNGDVGDAHGDSSLRPVEPSASPEHTPRG